jgi:hypothetical protein
MAAPAAGATVDRPHRGAGRRSRVTTLSVGSAAGVERPDDPDEPLPADTAFVDPLAVRLGEQYGVDPEDVRRRAGAVLARYADARVRTFVPLLVEKELRDGYRRAGRDAGTGRCS